MYQGFYLNVYKDKWTESGPNPTNCHDNGPFGCSGNCTPTSATQCGTGWTASGFGGCSGKSVACIMGCSLNKVPNNTFHCKVDNLSWEKCENGKNCTSSYFNHFDNKKYPASAGCMDDSLISSYCTPP